MNDDSKHDVARRFYFVVGLLLTGLLLAIYYFLAPSKHPEPNADISGGDKFVSFLLDLLPNLAAALLAFCTVYAFAKWVGIAPDAADKVAHMPPPPAMPPELSERLDRIETKLGENNAIGIVRFYQMFRQVDWNEWLSKAEREQTIVVNYAHTWLGNYEHLLINFLKKPSSSLTIYLPDPDDDATIKQLHTMYDDPTEPVDEEELRRKVRNTATRLRGFAEHAGANKNRIKVFWLKQRPNYALYLIDQRWAILSVYDHQRVLRVGAPTIVMDLRELPDVKSYFDHEFKKLQQTAKEG
ncbi:hypothetical protein [Archangium lipolyticum]|uniref:hypothetical protein n=1 Tax=Archangium lipolyticum TaxID=2970465 RepID=UPI00214A3ABD|nr:hypothetical protein [Archangium lipolyticum]